jgi:anti-sigma B factor antagonist
MAALRIEIDETSSSSVVVRLIGEFDMADEHAFSTVVTDGVVSGGCPRVRLDCARLTFIDSMGLRGLIRAKKKAGALGVRLVISGLQPSVRKVLEITDLVGWFEVES